MIKMLTLSLVGIGAPLLAQNSLNRAVEPIVWIVYL